MTKKDLESKIEFYKQKIDSSPEAIKKALIPVMQDLQNQLLDFSDEKLETIDQSLSILSNGEYYKIHEEHLLGEKAIGTTQYGKEYTFLKGDITVLDNIDVNIDFAQFLKEDNSAVSVTQPENVDENEEFVKEIIEKSNTDIGKKAVSKKRNEFDKIKDGYDPAEHPIQTYQEIFESLNPHIDKPNLQAYVWYKEQIGQRLSREWYKLADMDSITNIQELKTNWVKQGALFYYKGKLQPKPIYLSGDIYSKINRLKGVDNKPGEDGKIIVEKYGQETYDNQVKSLFSVYDRLFKSRLLITGTEGESSLILKPISEFAQTHKIKYISSMEKFEWFKVTAKTNFGQPNFYKTDGRNWDKKTFDFVLSN